MSRAYLDPSFIVCLFVRQRMTERAETWLGANELTLIVSDFGAAEVSSAVSRLVRQRELSQNEAERVLLRFDRWRISSTVHRLTSPGDIAACERLVRRFELKLQAPDALHIAIALGDGATLVTFDERQAQAMAGLGPCIVPA